MMPRGESPRGFIHHPSQGRHPGQGVRFAGIAVLTSAGQSASVTRIAAVKAPVDPARRVSTLGFPNCSEAVCVVAEVDLIAGRGHVRTPGRCIMDFVVAVRLRVCVDDELGHRATSCSGFTACRRMQRCTQAQTGEMPMH